MAQLLICRSTAETEKNTEIYKYVIFSYHYNYYGDNDPRANHTTIQPTTTVETTTTVEPTTTPEPTTSLMTTTPVAGNRR